MKTLKDAFFSLRARLSLIFLIFSIVLVASISFLAQRFAREALEGNAVDRLTTISLLKASELNRWNETNKKVIRLLADRPLVQEYAERLSSSRVGEEGFGDLRHRLIDNHFQPSLEQQGGYQKMSLLDVESGQILVSTDPGLEGKFRESAPFFVEGRERTYVENPRYELAEGEPVTHISTPVLNPEGIVVAVLVGHVDIAELSRIMAEHRGLSASLETYLVNQSNLLITESRFEEEAAFRKSIFTEGVEACLQGQNGQGIYEDYRGVEVVGIYRWLPEWGMCILTEQDESEAFAPVMSVGNAIWGVGVGVMIIGALVGFLSARGITQPLRKLKKGVQTFGEGNLDVRIQLDTQDEIGEVASTFNDMASNLKKSYQENERLIEELQGWSKQLEKQVEEQTAELKKEIEERKRMEEILRASEEEFREIFNATSDALILLDQKGHIVRVNDTVSQLYGYGEDELLAMNPLELIHTDYHHTFEKFIADISSRGEFSGETVDVKKTGETFFTDVRGTTVRFQGEEYILAAIRDVTERTEAEMKLEETMQELERSNEELQRFAYVASHDLQEPLRMVSSYLQLLERRYGDLLEGDAREFIDYAVDGAVRMKQLINDLLTYSRVNTHGKEFKQVAMDKVMDSVLSNLQILIAETEAQISWDPLPDIIGDPSQLRQLFQNLIHNAIKFRGENIPKIHVSARHEKAGWIFSVEDNGIGIDEKYQERVFVIFQRLHTSDEYQGTGIGLAVSKRIVTRHGGNIWFESSPGEGTTFYFSIPDEPVETF